MKKTFLWVLMAAFLTSVLPWLGAQTICDNSTLQQNGLVYELWKDEGEACLTIDTHDSLSLEWQIEGTMIARAGMRPGSKDLVFNYSIDLQTDGNAWAGVYGWTENTEKNYYFEYYIIDTWSSWRPPGWTILGTVESDGGVYDIYNYQDYSTIFTEDPRVKDQYYSVRQNKRTSGTITVANHFNAWKVLNMNMGKLYDVSFAIEAYQSFGYANVYSLSITETEPTENPSPPPYLLGDVNGDSLITIIDSLLITQFYVGIEPRNFIEKNADVNHDSEITIIDALLIAQCYVGQTTCDF